MRPAALRSVEGAEHPVAVAVHSLEQGSAFFLGQPGDHAPASEFLVADHAVAVCVEFMQFHSPSAGTMAERHHLARLDPPVAVLVDAFEKHPLAFCGHILQPLVGRELLVAHPSVRAPVSGCPSRCSRRGSAPDFARFSWRRSAFSPWRRASRPGTPSPPGGSAAAVSQPVKIISKP